MADYRVFSQRRLHVLTVFFLPSLSLLIPNLAYSLCQEAYFIDIVPVRMYTKVMRWGELVRIRKPVYRISLHIEGKLVARWWGSQHWCVLKTRYYWREMGLQSRRSPLLLIFTRYLQTEILWFVNWFRREEWTKTGFGCCAVKLKVGTFPLRSPIAARQDMSVYRIWKKK